MDIPREIYLNIFQFLYRTELMECSIVCREWNLPALEIYYHELSFDRFNAHRLISALARGQQHCFQHCHWVKTLNLSPEVFENFYRVNCRELEKEELKHLARVNRIMTNEHILRFLTYLPNLKKLSIDTNGSIDCVQYLAYLNTNIYLTHLEEIHIDNDSYCYGGWPYTVLNDIYYNFRASLKEVITFSELKSNTSTRYDGVISYLNQFKALTHLTYDYQPKQAVTVYQLQVACPNLTTLKVTVGDCILEYEERNNTFLNTSNLQSLTLSVPRMSASYTDMLIHHLPTKLKKLYIHLKDIDFYDWIDDIGLERVLELAERMSKLSSAEIRCGPGNCYETRSVHEVSQMTLFFQVLNVFKGDKEVFCKAEFSDLRPAYRSMSYSDGVLEVLYGLKKQDIYGHNQADTTFDFELAVPDKTVSIIGPEIFNRLKFFINHTNDQLIYKILKYALTNCNYLQYVEFTERDNTCHHELYLYNTTDRHFNYYTHKQLQPSSKTEDNLKVIKLKNFIPSDDFLHMLATYLPNVNFFQCGGAKDIIYSAYTERPRPTIINLSGFNKLDIFNLDMNLYSTKSDKIWSLKINYMNVREARYYIIKKVKHNPNRSLEIVGVYSLDTPPTLTLNFNKTMKLIQLRRGKGERDMFKIKDGVLQEACS